MDVHVAEVELRHTANECRAECLRILQELSQPLARNGGSLPGEVGRHVTTVAVDHVTAEAAQVAHELTRVSCRLVLRLLYRRDAHRRGLGCRAVRLSQ